MSRRRRSSKSEHSFDPNRHNGKDPWISRLKDVGWFVKAQGVEAKQMLIHTWRLSRDLIRDMRNSRRK